MLTYLSPKFLTGVCHKLRGEGKVVGLITGCFDIVHIGHIDLFRYAKEYVDVLVVGLEHDESIRISKRDNHERPVFSLEQRNQIIREFRSVDYTFHVDKIYDFRHPKAHNVYRTIVQELRPQVLITAPFADKYLTERMETAKLFDAKYLPYKKRYPSSTSSIVRHIEKEME